MKTDITIKNRVNSYMQNYNIFSLKGKGILILLIEQQIKVFVSKPWMSQDLLSNDDLVLLNVTSI